MSSDPVLFLDFQQIFNEFSMIFWWENVCFVCSFFVFYVSKLETLNIEKWAFRLGGVAKNGMSSFGFKDEILKEMLRKAFQK